MGILYTILIGLIAGLVARLLHPGKESLGLIMTSLLQSHHLQIRRGAF